MIESITIIENIFFERERICKTQDPTEKFASDETINTQPCLQREAYDGKNNAVS